MAEDQELEKKVELSTPSKLKDFVNGENGELIRLVDIGNTRDELTKLALKYKHLKVTKENYKREGADAERTLRETRYLLQNIHKKNNKFLNDVKTQEKTTFDSLIALIQGEENRLKSDIKAIEDEEKRLKEQEEAKREAEKKRVDELLSSWDENLEKMLLNIKSDEQLDVYDKSLEELKEILSEFDGHDREFEFKRLFAKYSGRRTEAVKNVEQIKKEQEEKRLFEEDKSKFESTKKKVFDFRVSQLEKKGLDKNTDGFFIVGSKKEKIYTEEMISDSDEVEWFQILEEIEEENKVVEEDKKSEASMALSEMLTKWNEMIDVFIGLGGNASSWELAKDELPNQDKIEALRKATIQLHEQKKMLKEQKVKAEINPFQTEVLEFFQSFEARVKEAKFENPETMIVLNTFIDKVSGVCNEVFGEVN